MDVISLFNEQVKARFIANATIQQIAAKLNKKAEELAFNKYKDKILYRDGLEYELLGVTSFFDHWNWEARNPKVSLVLAYFCTSKTTKYKRERIAEAKKNYLKTKVLDWTKSDVPLWFELPFLVELEQVVEESFILNIK